LRHGYKEPGFQERVAAANTAREKALEKLRSKPPVDEAELARKAAAQAAKEAAAAEKRAAQIAAREEARLAKIERDRIAAEEALANQPKVMTEEERKAARDARYAARKARKR
jgi:hypothetical protein